ncbi:TPA: hypothetical protein SB499_001859, partial [Campylobacter jejuni]|nr:hypothetical protein [Campylobacter jejuni]
LIPARITHHEKKIIQNEIIKVLNAFRINFGASHIEVKFETNGGGDLKNANYQS